MEFDLYQKYVPQKQKFVKLLGGVVEFYVYLQYQILNAIVMTKTFWIKKLIWLLVIGLPVWLFPSVAKYIAIVSSSIIYLVIGFVILLVYDDSLSYEFSERSVLLVTLRIVSFLLWPVFIVFWFIKSCFETTKEKYGKEES